MPKVGQTLAKHSQLVFHSNRLFVGLHETGQIFIGALTTLTGVFIESNYNSRYEIHYSATILL